MRVRVAGILLKDSSLLLIKHRKDGKDYWLLPGGGIRVGESIHQALRREISEELQIEAEVDELLFVVEITSENDKHIIQPTFSIRVDDVKSIRVGTDPRVVDFQFFDHSTIGNVTVYPDIKDELKKFLETMKISSKYIFKKWID